MIKKIKMHLAATSALATTSLANIASAQLTPRGAQGDLISIIDRILAYVIGIAGAIAVIYLIFGGFQYLTSGGNEKSVTAAKNTIMYAIVGLIIIALAFAIKAYVMGLLGAGPEKL